MCIPWPLWLLLPSPEFLSLFPWQFIIFTPSFYSYGLFSAFIISGIYEVPVKIRSDHLLIYEMYFVYLIHNFIVDIVSFCYNTFKYIQ
jgi:hypothetical protein